MFARAEPDGGFGRLMRVRRGATVSILLLGGLISFVPPAAAGPDRHQAAQTDDADDETGTGEDGTGIDLRVAVGVDGAYTPGRHLPLRFLIDAGRILTGELRVTTTIDGSDQRIVVPVDVPGGSSKRYVAVVPTSIWNGAARISVELVEGDEVIAEDSFRPSYDEGTLLVGVSERIATADELPEQSSIALADDDDVEAHFASLGVDLLDAGAPALDVFDTIAVAAGDLAELTDTQRAGLLAWVNVGGDLLIDAPPGTTIAALPTLWQPGDDTVQPAGSGRVRLTDGAAADGAWSTILAPPAARSPSQNQAAGDFSGVSQLASTVTGTLTQSLSDDAGFELPDLPWLLGILALYVAVVGPIAYLAFRFLRRPSLLWIVIPATAIAFTAIVFSLGDRLRDKSEFAHATVLDIHADGALATTHVLATSRGGGASGIETPPGWATLAPVTNPFMFFPGMETESPPPVTASAGAGGGTATVDLDPGAFDRVAATGAISRYADALEVTVTSNNDNTIHGTVRNNLDVALHEVAVFAGSMSVRSLDDLEPGEEVEFDLRGMSVASANTGQSPEMIAWSDEFSFNQGFDQFGRPIVAERVGPRPLVNAPLWVDFAQRALPLLRDRGLVVVAGWTDELEAPVTADSGDAIVSGRTVVVRRQAVEPEGRITDVTVSRHALPSDGQQFFGGGDLGPTLEVMFQLPTGDLDGRELTLDIPSWAADTQVWSGGEWMWVTGDNGDQRIVAIPPEAIGAATIHVRYTLDYNRAFTGASRVDLLVREPADDETLEYVGLLTDDEHDALEDASDAAADAEEAADAEGGAA